MRPRKRAQRATVYNLCSLALQYPDGELVAAREELAAAADDLGDGPAARSVGRFFAWFVSVPALDLARQYVQVFDLGKRSALSRSRRQKSCRPQERGDEHDRHLPMDRDPVRVDRDLRPRAHLALPPRPVRLDQPID